ncbi:MAG: hypothetical protein MJ071_07080 [Oscillospiraceae bacterium]|nr:hypothetical protein [Oscillospiraceae bacterium]
MEKNLKKPKKQSFKLAFLILLACCVILILVSVFFVILYVQNNAIHPMNEAYVKFPSQEESAPDEETSVYISQDVRLYAPVLKEAIEKYGEPYAASVLESPGVIGQVYASHLYYLQGVYAEWIDVDGDGKMELFCGGIGDEKERGTASLYAITGDQMVTLKTDMQIMYLPEDNKQTVFMKLKDSQAYYVVDEEYYPNGDQVVLREFFQKNRGSLKSDGKYLVGDADAAEKYDSYIRTVSLVNMPLSFEMENEELDIARCVAFPPTGISKEAAEEYAESAVKVIREILG